MSLPESEFFSDEFLTSRQELVNRLIAEKNIPALSQLLEEDRSNLQVLRAELNSLGAAISNISKIKQYE